MPISKDMNFYRRLRRRPDGSTAIERVIGDLENLNRSTERDFLAVGEKLMEFRSAARRISADIEVLTGLISGEQGCHASQALERILELSRRMQEYTGDSGQALGTVGALSGRMRQIFSGLPNTAATFRTLCTLTRIETSRLGVTSAGFGDLAEEVRPLSESIQSGGEAVLEASSRLGCEVQAATRHACELRARQLQELPPLIDAVLGNIQDFAERQQRAAEASRRQSAQYEAVGAAVDGLVRSIQFHDITHQQIEHVVEALRQAGSGDGPDRRGLLTLQASQLHSAAWVFASAIEGIERDLEAIGTRLGSMAESSGSLLGGSEGEHDSFFLRMEDGFSAILQAVAAGAAAQAEMRSTAEAIEEMMGRMRGQIAEIGGIEIRIQRIAINATIRAAHLGVQGNPLAVIAQVMEGLIAGSEGHSGEAARTLDGISQAARRLAGGTDVESGASEAGRQMRLATLEMHSASEIGFSRVKQIADLGARLVADIGALRGGFSAGQAFAEVVLRAAGELERIAAEGPVGAPETASVHQMQSLERNYTMQMERDVHERVAQGSTISAPLPEELSAVVSEEVLGDNVEFF